MTGIRFVKESGYTFELGLGTGLSQVKLVDKDGAVFKQSCINGQTRLGMGFKNYMIEFQAGYYMNSAKCFSAISINYKYKLG